MTSDGTSTNSPKQPLTIEIRYTRKYPSENVDEEDDDVSSYSSSLPMFALIHDNTAFEFSLSVSERLLDVVRTIAGNERGMPCAVRAVVSVRSAGILRFRS